MRANYKEREVLHDGSLHSIKEGQFITGRKVLARELNSTEQKIRSRIALLEKMGNIVVKSTNKFSIITVVNWEQYQTERNDLTNKQPTDNQQITTDNKVNKVNKKLASKKPYGEFQQVRLTDVEKEKFIDSYGHSQAKALLTELDQYLESTGKKYKSHYATLLAWARKKKLSKNVAPPVAVVEEVTQEQTQANIERAKRVRDNLKLR